MAIMNTTMSPFIFIGQNKLLSDHVIFIDEGMENSLLSLYAVLSAYFYSKQSCKNFISNTPTPWLALLLVSKKDRVNQKSC